jgi:hypothetical protein
MRIAYLVHFRGGEETGIFRKVATQAYEWSRLGATVGLFVTTAPESARDWRELSEAVSVRPGARSARDLLVGRERLAGDLLHWRPDIVYARHTLLYPGLLRIERSRPTVFEINSNDLTEFGLTSRRRHRYARLTRSLLLRSAAGLVYVTRELAREPEFARYRKPSVVIANGIRLTDVEPFPPVANERPRLIFMGHPHSPWHGVDKVNALAAAFPGWAFDIVGPGADELQGPQAPNVRVHGVLRPDDFRPLLADADVAISTLALHRNRMEEACPLKLREYLAAGLPSIIGYEDTDFPEGADFLLRIANREIGVADSLDEIAGFVTRWKGRRVPREAVARIDVGEKERERLRFLEGLAR